MNVSIDWETAETIGVNYIKESYITLLETMEGYDDRSRLTIHKRAMSAGHACCFQLS